MAELVPMARNAYEQLGFSAHFLGLGTRKVLHEPERCHGSENRYG